MIDNILNHYFDICETTNGYRGKSFSKFKEYQKRKLGNLKRYTKYNKKQK